MPKTGEFIARANRTWLPAGQGEKALSFQLLELVPKLLRIRGRRDVGP